MPQYSNTNSTSYAGYTVTTVLNTETNLQTITVTAPDGKTATATQPANFTRATIATLHRIVDTFNTNVTDITKLANITSMDGAIRVSITNVVRQAQTADAAAIATSTPVPDNPSPPVPINSTTDPAAPLPTPAPSTVTAVVTSPPSSGTDPARQAFLDANAEPATISAPPNITREQQAFLEANQADEGTIQAQKTPSREEQAFLDANAEPATLASAPDIDVSQDDAENAKFNRQQALANASPTSSNPSATGSARGLSGRRKNTRAQATAQDSANYNLLKDWRIRLSLAPGDKSNYLYKANPAGILAPLKNTDGVIFPYTPTVTINYVAGYEPTELTHSNYKSFNYKSSGIDSIYISGEFTAQNTAEANYVLAVIHFFRSVTKMFYGQDSDPINGTPPPLCYLHGYGAFNFDNHPLVISNFTYTLPNDVDYIRATSTYTEPAGTNSSRTNIPDPYDIRFARMNSSNIKGGGKLPDTKFNDPKISSNNTGGTVDATYVPTKLTIQINAYPIVSRNDISRRFSLEKYATGELLRGSKQNSGGIW